MSIYVISGKPRHGKTYFIASTLPQRLYDCIEDEKYLAQQEKGADISELKPPLDDTFPVSCIYPNFKVLLGRGALKEYPERIIGDLHNEMDLRNPTKLIFPWYYIEEWKYMKRPGTILCTEAYRYVNSRSWAKLSDETQAKLMMHGHEGLSVLFDLQRFGSIDVIIRETCEGVGIVKMIHGNPDSKFAPTLPFLPWVFKQSQIVWIDPDQFERYNQIKMSINPKTGTFYELEELGIEILDTQTFWHRKDIYSIYDTREKPVTFTLTESTMMHDVKYCIDPDCPVYGKNKGHPLIHGRHFKDYVNLEGKFVS